MLPKKSVLFGNTNITHSRQKKFTLSGVLIEKRNTRSTVYNCQLVFLCANLEVKLMHIRWNFLRKESLQY